MRVTKAAAFLLAVTLPPIAFALATGIEGLATGPLLALFILGLPFMAATGEPLIGLAAAAALLLALAL